GPQLFFDYKNIPELPTSDLFCVYTTPQYLYAGSLHQDLKKFKIGSNSQIEYINSFPNSKNTKVVYQTKDKKTLVGKKDGLFIEQNNHLVSIPKLKNYPVILIHETDDFYFIGTYGKGLVICDKKFNIHQILNSTKYF